jgi:hypothetical protein
MTGRFMGRLHCETCACRVEEGDVPVEATVVYGLCTACGAVEVALVRATGRRDIGESVNYPTGHGCELCA